jgi:hypothetical protein
MKKLFIFAAFFFLLFGSTADNSFSQARSAVITSKTIEYNRQGFKQGEFKSTFTVVYPRFKVLGNRSVERKIRKAIDYESIFEVSIEENRLANETDLTSLYYKIFYNKRDFLDIVLFMETLGAYPWTTKKEIVFDLKTGNILTAENCFVESRFDELAKAITLKLRAETRQAKRKYGGFPPESENARIDLEDLDNFSVGDKGVTFHFDYGFNFASLSLQPKGEFFFNWKQMKRFIRRDGLLAKFIG